MYVQSVSAPIRDQADEIDNSRCKNRKEENENSF